VETRSVANTTRNLQSDARRNDDDGDDESRQEKRRRRSRSPPRDARSTRSPRGFDGNGVRDVCCCFSLTLVISGSSGSNNRGDSRPAFIIRLRRCGGSTYQHKMVATRGEKA